MDLTAAGHNPTVHEALLRQEEAGGQGAGADLLLPTVDPTTQVPADIFHQSQVNTQTTSLTLGWTVGWTEAVWTEAWTELVLMPGPGVPQEVFQAQEEQEVEEDLDIIL